MDETCVIFRFVGRTLVWGNRLLFVGLSSSTIPEEKIGDLRIMFGRVLKGMWTAVFANIILMGLFPNLFVWQVKIPHVGLVFMCYVLLSVVYGLMWLHSQGMKNGRVL